MKADNKLTNKIGKRKIIADIILVAVLLAVGLSVFLITELSKSDGAYVLVTVDGEGVTQIDLSEDGEYELNGGTNILVIENGEAYVRSASCPDGLCIHQGKISKTGERIVCLPNKVMIEVFGADEEILEI